MTTPWQTKYGEKIGLREERQKSSTGLVAGLHERGALEFEVGVFGMVSFCSSEIGKRPCQSCAQVYVRVETRREEE